MGCNGGTAEGVLRGGMGIGGGTPGTCNGGWGVGTLVPGGAGVGREDCDAGEALGSSSALRRRYQIPAVLATATTRSPTAITARRIHREERLGAAVGERG
jgi:hypothetical protein